MLIIRGVNVYPSQIEAILVDLPDIAPHYQLVLTSEGTLDKLTIEVEVSPQLPTDEATLQAKAESVQHATYVAMSLRPLQCAPRLSLEKLYDSFPTVLQGC